MSRPPTSYESPLLFDEVVLSLTLSMSELKYEFSSRSVDLLKLNEKFGRNSRVLNESGFQSTRKSPRKLLPRSRVALFILEKVEWSAKRYWRS